MKIIFSNHSKTKLYFLGIDAWKVNDAIRSPSWKKDQKDGSILVRKSFEGKELEVVYVEYTNKIIVKTAYYVD